MDERKECSIEELLSENEALKAENKAAREHIAALSALQRVIQSLVSELDLKPLLKKIPCSAMEVMDASGGSLLLVDPVTDELVLEVAEGDGEPLPGQRMAKDEGVAGLVVTSRRPLIVNGVGKDRCHCKDIEAATDSKADSLICVPLLAKGRVIGALEILDKRSGEEFDADDLEILTAFADQAAIAIENARLYHNLRMERDGIAVFEEEVRRRLSRDLHDGPAQLLSAMIMSVQLAKQVLSKAPEKLDKLRDELEELEPIAAKALNQIRIMLFDLRPVILETHGLAPALQSYVKRLRLASDFAVSLAIEDFAERLDAKTEATIFSIVQEAVSNARKHAHASHLELRMAKRDGKLVVTVRDDGRGFEVVRMGSSYDQRKRLGLFNMCQRAEMLKGSFSIESAVGQGTLVKLIVPIQASEGMDPSEVKG